MDRAYGTHGVIGAFLSPRVKTRGYKMDGAYGFALAAKL